MRSETLVLSALSCLLMSGMPKGEPPATLDIAVTPQSPCIEQGRGEQLLSFDFLFRNSGDETLRLKEIVLCVFDRKGALVQRRLARRGTASTLESPVPIPSHQTMMFLNPFYTFASDVDLAKLHFHFVFTDTKTGEKEIRSEVTITPVSYRQKTNLVLPLQGKALIYSGHDFYDHHRRVDLADPLVVKLGVTTNPTRYAYDFCPVNEQGDLFRGQGTANEEWYGWGAPVYAPGSGVVVEARNDVSDNILGKKAFDFQIVFQDLKNFFGNYMIIDHQNGENSIIMHLKQGSVLLKAGMKVKQGQMLGQVGMSGDADYVHIHYQLQRGLGLTTEPLPSYFRSFRAMASPSRIRTRERIETGEIVTSTTPEKTAEMDRK